MKPTIDLGGDQTPEMQESEVETSADEAPVGDILELTRRVKAAVPSTSEANLPTEQAARRTKGKGKGVGKGCSSSSGPPVKKRKPRKPPTPSSFEYKSSDAEAGEFEMQEVATQSIMVKNKCGYTTYPAYLFDVPPRKLRMDNLEKAYDC